MARVGTPWHEAADATPVRVPAAARVGRVRPAGGALQPPGEYTVTIDVAGQQQFVIAGIRERIR